MKNALGRGVLAAAMVSALGGLTCLTTTAASAATTPVGPDTNITVAVGDDVAGGTYDIEFVPAYAGATPTALPSTSMSRRAGTSTAEPASSASTRTSTRTPPTRTRPAAVPSRTTLMTAASIDELGDELANQVVAIDEAHFGAIGDAERAEPAATRWSCSFYNVFDDGVLRLRGDHVHGRLLRAGLRRLAGMNVIVIDTNDSEEMTGSLDDATRQRPST